MVEKRTTIIKATAMLGGSPIKIMVEGSTELREAGAIRECSTDIPGDILGEAAVEALQLAWKGGYDPTKLSIVLTFW